MALARLVKDRSAVWDSTYYGKPCSFDYCNLQYRYELHVLDEEGIIQEQVIIPKWVNKLIWKHHKRKFHYIYDRDNCTAYSNWNTPEGMQERVLYQSIVGDWIDAYLEVESWSPESQRWELQQ